MARLGDICKFQSGGTPSKSEPSYFSGPIPWVTTVALNGDIICGENAVDWITEKALNESAAKLVPANSILVGTRVGIGKVAINSVPMATSQDIISLLEINETQWDKPFLCKWISSKNKYLQSQARGATIKGIKIETIANLEIPEIQIDMQRSISAILDNVQNLISLRKQQLAKLDELVKARFVEMFGDPVSNPHNWDCKMLGQIMTVEPQNGLYKPQSDYTQDGDGISILRIDAFYNGKVTDFSTLRRLNCSEAEIQKYCLFDNDIVINRVNSIEYLGKCAIIRDMPAKTVFESNVMRFHLNESIANAKYITHLLCTQYIYNQILERAKKAVNQASINQRDVQSLKVLVPPLSLQNEFDLCTNQIDKSRLTIQQSLDKLDVLKKTLMQEYFRQEKLL